MPVRTLGPEGSGFGGGLTSITRRSASENAGPEEEWNVMSRIG